MEKKLKAIFDYQRFESSPRLGKLIRETEAHCAAELDDEVLDMVAGGVNTNQTREQILMTDGEEVGDGTPHQPIHN